MLLVTAQKGDHCLSMGNAFASELQAVKVTIFSF